VIKDSGLANYADLLQSKGFAIYEPTGTTGDYFTYSQIVDGTECFGTVQLDYASFGSYSHTMPIKPSVEHGSSMFVQSVPNAIALTVAAAKLVARPTNWNSLVGHQRNYRESEWLDKLYTKR
jgi:hypothetical protein